MKTRKLISFHILLFPILSASAGLVVEDLGKEYSYKTGHPAPGLYHHIENDDDVIGGNTSIRNESVENLAWKGKPDSNGFGYFQRNRDLGQVFNVPAEHDITVEAIVLRTSRGNNAVMSGAPGARLYVQFFEVVIPPGAELRINENGTSKGDEATHGFDHQFNRADDFIEGPEYIPLSRATGGIFPAIPATDQYVYDRGRGGSFGEQDGHLRFLRFDLTDDDEIVLRAGKRYAFMVGFEEPGDNRGVALAIDTKVHTKEAAEFVRDENGTIRWGIRREGNGNIVPTMISGATPPDDPALRRSLESESVFKPKHWETLSPTTNGYPDVDTYRTLQFYIEVKTTSD